MNFNFFLYKFYLKKINNCYFDKEYYLLRYPELKKINLIENHWNEYGMKQHKICSEKYEKIYYKLYKEALKKYLITNRKKIMFNIFYYYIFLNINHKFDKKYYFNSYKDIHKYYNIENCIFHWMKYGNIEFRNCSHEYKILKNKLFNLAKKEFKLFFNNKKKILDILDEYIFCIKSKEISIELITKKNIELIKKYHQEGTDKKKIIDALSENNLKRSKIIDEIEKFNLKIN
jgi:hypothetical protein